MHAYNILGLIRRSFSPSLNLSMKMKLYLTLVDSQLMYCTPIWHPYLQKDIQNNIERIQRRATKFILNDYDSNYKTQLLTQTLASDVSAQVWISRRRYSGVIVEQSSTISKVIIILY